MVANALNLQAEELAALHDLQAATSKLPLHDPVWAELEELRLMDDAARASRTGR